TPLPLKEKEAIELPDMSLAEAKPAPVAPPSVIEKFYRDVTNDQSLTQYGYNFFNVKDNDIAPAAGAVSGEYLLGAGDRINVVFLGERKDRNTYAIDRAGALSIDLMPPVSAAGKTLDALREDVQHLLDAQGYHGEIFLSLEHVRQVGV